MNTARWFEPPYPCGCVRGSFLCPVAENLWRASIAAYQQGDDDEGKRLRGLYEAHFEQAQEAKHGI